METIKLDLIPGKKMPSLHASQFDDGRAYHIDLTENRVPYTLDGTETISVIVRKCDNTLVSMDIANTFADKSYIEFITTEQMTACSGFNYGEIILEKNGDRLGSLNFYLQVEAAPDENGITSQSEIKNLTRQVHDIVVEELADNGAEETGYDNTDSGLEATNVQDAIDEVNTKIENIPSVDAYTKEESDQKYATKTSLSEVATSGKYDDLLDKPTVAVIDDTQASASKTYSSNKVVNLLSDKASASEVSDIRIGADGKTYASAGDAVRGQIGNLETSFNEAFELKTEYSRNMFDKTASVLGLLNSSGGVGTSSNFYTSDFIKINPNVDYRGVRWYGNEPVNCYIRAMFFYTSSKEPIGTRLNDVISGTAPTNSAYVRISISIDYYDVFMLLLGDTSDPYGYIPYKSTVVSTADSDSDYKNTKELGYLTEENTNSNLSDFFIGHYYINSNGEISKSSVWNAFLIKADFIETLFKGYCNNTLYAVGFYSSDIPSDDNFISGLKGYKASDTFVNRYIIDTVPNGTKSVLLCSRDATNTITAINVKTAKFKAQSVQNNKDIEFLKSEIDGKGNVYAVYKNIPNDNDFVIIKDEIWFAEVIYDQGVATNNNTIHRYKIKDGFLVPLADIQTDFGHWNTVDYNEDNDCLVFGNGANDVGTVGNWFAVVPHPLSLSGTVSLANVGIKYDVDIGFKVQAVWGDSNLGQNNVVYLISNSCNTITKVLLTRDANGDFDGNFVTLESHDLALGEYFGVGGADFWGDTLYIGIGGPYDMFKMSMTDYSIQKISKHFYLPDGTELSGSTQGVHIDSRYLIVFSNTAGNVNGNYLVIYRR